MGGGLGGLCAASALLSRDHEVHVYEAAPRLMEVGGGLTLGPNAMKALRSIGLEDAVRTIGWSGQHQLTHHWRSGRVLSRTSSSNAVARYGAANCTVHRGELLATFADALHPDVVTVGARCEAVATEGDVAVARVADGREVEADVVLGAYGIRSAVRARLFGPDAPRFTGKILYRTDPIPVDSVPEGHPHPTATWLGPHGAVVFFRVRGGTKINMHAHHDDESYTTESWVTECDRDEVLAVHQRWHESLNRLFSVSQVWYKWALYDRDPILQWSKGRATLRGDAAHPMLAVPRPGGVPSHRGRLRAFRRLERHAARRARRARGLRTSPPPTRQPDRAGGAGTGLLQPPFVAARHLEAGPEDEVSSPRPWTRGAR